MPIEQQTHLRATPQPVMPLIICPGFHHRSWTDAFLQNVSFPDSHPLWLFPTEKYPAYSGIHLLEFMRGRMDCKIQNPFTVPRNYSPILISFSAGVVGAVQAAWAWQQLGGQISAILAIDGWGVPLVPQVPCYRLSHDLFTHWSSTLLGTGYDSFYAAPDKKHADLWQAPQQVEGWWIDQEQGTQRPITAAAFIEKIVQRHGTVAP